MRYTEVRPPSDIAAWIACFWQIAGKGASGSVSHRVLPDGCADLVFDIDAVRHGGGSAAEVVGPMSSASVLVLRNDIEIVGVRVRPGAIATFSGIPAGSLVDSSLPLVDLPQPLRVSAQTLARCTTTRARCELLAAMCRKRIASLDKPDPVVGYALARWSGAWSGAAVSSLPTVSVLTRDIGLSERAFERRFLAHVGLTPVHYRRLARFRRVLRLHAGGVRSWADLAATAGFSDQSHLVRDFRTFAGLTPTAWAAAQAGPAGFLQDGHITAL